MGTMAMFWDADPLDGGRAIGWFGLDGHPSNFRTLALADSAQSFARRVGAYSRGRKARYWFRPLPGCWAYWPSSGYSVMDYGYWFDAKSGRTMLINHQSAARPFEPGMAAEPESWPCWSRDGVDERRRHLLLPELHATVPPDAEGEFHHHTCSPVPLDLLLESAAALGRGMVLRRLPQAPWDGRPVRGLWSPEGSGGCFEVEDTAGSRRASDRRLADLLPSAAQALALRPRENGDAMRCYKRYSAEALLDEAAEGTATIAAEAGTFDVEIVHPAIGSVRAVGDRLPHVVLEVRRKLHADPRFRLSDPPPHR